MFLLSTMNKDTSFVEAVGYILVVGFGIGVTLTTATVVVQNSTPYRLLGVATSVLQFFRTASGTLGFALLGALLRARFSWGLSEQLPAEVREGLLPGQIEAITANPQDYVGTNASAIPLFGETVSNARELTVALFTSMGDALAGAISYVFFISAALLVLSVLAALFLPTQRAAGE